MRIAQVAPLYESVPPAKYGGTERVVHWLTEELVALGHDVTLFASKDSQTSAHLVPCAPQALRLAGVEDDITPHILELERAIDPAHGFDIIHFHTGTLHLPLARRTLTSSVTTMHGRLDHADTIACLREFRDIPLVSISDEQREPIPLAHWVGTVHHGLPLDLLAPGDGGDYLAFLGRISREKRPDRAIEIARRAKLPLKIAAKVGEKDRCYFEQEIEPLLKTGVDVEFLGEVDDHGKQALLGGARALLFPIDWPEPFGIAMIEALACGTPVIASPCGSVPSIVDDGETGFIVSSIEEAVDAVHKLDRIKRGDCRHTFERRFSSTRMAQDYVRVFETLLERSMHEMAWRAT